MNFLKNLFDDESTIIGLCGFNLEKSNYNQNLIKKDLFFNSFQIEKVFETDFTKNVLLL